MVIQERYEVPCLFCDGTGCMNCRSQGTEPVYVLVSPKTSKLCALLGHKMIGHTERATDASQLPHVAWCVRCGRQQVHTVAPEAYDVSA